MVKLRFNKNFNINRVVRRLAYTVLALYVGGTILDVFGTVMNCTQSPFYTGLQLIGWKVGTVTNATPAGYLCRSATWPVLDDTPYYNTLYDSKSSAGVLAVVGLIGIASVVMEFISFN